MRSDDEVFEAMSVGWLSGLYDGTPCGRGSSLDSTEAVRAWLPEMAERYKVSAICDAGAGDLHWISHIRWQGPIAYWPFDLVLRHPGVTQADITRERLPSCDLILCRQVLNHLEPQRVIRALRLFRQSARFLAATTFTDHRSDTSDFTSYDLRIFGLGEPLESVTDCDGAGELALWKL